MEKVEEVAYPVSIPLAAPLVVSTIQQPGKKPICGANVQTRMVNGKPTMVIVHENGSSEMISPLKSKDGPAVEVKEQAEQGGNGGVAFFGEWKSQILAVALILLAYEMVRSV